MTTITLTPEQVAQIKSMPEPETVEHIPGLKDINAIFPRLGLAGEGRTLVTDVFTVEPDDGIQSFLFDTSETGIFRFMTGGQASNMSIFALTAGFGLRVVPLHLFVEDAIDDREYPFLPSWEVFNGVDQVVMAGLQGREIVYTTKQGRLANPMPGQLVLQYRAARGPATTKITYLPR